MDIFTEGLNDKIVDKLLYILETEKHGNENQTAKVKYVLTYIINAAEKMISLLVLFGAIHRLKEFIISSISLVSLRIFMGGMHRKTALGCFLHTFSVFLLLVLAGRVLPIWYPIVWIVFAITAVLIWRFTPLPSENLVSYSKCQCKCFQWKAWSVLVLLAVVVKRMPERDGNYVVWAVIFQSVEVLVVILKNWREEERD